MHIRCPHCRQPVEVVHDAELDEITCPSCGSGFNVVRDDETVSRPREKARTLAHFELLEELGAGQFGCVYKARDTLLDRIVAVKIPRAGNLDSEQQQLFFRDARAAAQLRHDGIVCVHEIGREEDTIFIASEYIEGADLKDWLKVHKLSSRDTASLMAQIADAVHHAHEQGVIHRDLKPANILMDADGNPHVADFGLAKRETGEITMTEDGRILGTPAYMSPEQARGKGHDADRRSDVYSLGVMLFELLTGELPFRGSVRMLIVQILNDEPPSPRTFASNVPRDLEVICLKCLDKVPGRRYQTSQDLATELRRYLHGEPISARPVGRVERGFRWCQRNRAAASLIATSILLFLLLGIGGPTIAYRESVAARREGSLRQAQTTAIRETRALVGEHLTILRDNNQLNRPEFQQLRVQLLNQSLAALAKIDQSMPDSSESWQLIADTYHSIGVTHEVAGALQDAVTSYSNASQYYSKIVARNSKDKEAVHQLASCLRQLQTAYTRVGNFNRALEVCEQMTPLYESLAEVDPFAFHKELAYAYDNHGGILLALQRKSEGREYILRGLDVQKALVNADPADVELQRGLAYFYNNLGSVDAEVGDLSSAEVSHREATRIRKSIVDKDLRDNSRYEEFKADLARSRYRLAYLLRITRRAEDGAVECQAAFDILNEILAANPTRNAYHEQFAECCHTLALLKLGEGKYDDVIVVTERGVQSMAYLKGVSVPSPARLMLTAHLHSAAMQAHLRLGQWGGWRESARASAALWRDVLAQEFPLDDEDRTAIALSLRTFGDLCNPDDESAKRDVVGAGEILSKIESQYMLVQIATYWSDVARLLGERNDANVDPKRVQDISVDGACDSLELAAQRGALNADVLTSSQVFDPLRTTQRFQNVLNRAQGAALQRPVDGTSEKSVGEQ